MARAFLKPMFYNDGAAAYLLKGGPRIATVFDNARGTTRFFGPAVSNEQADAKYVEAIMRRNDHKPQYRVRVTLKQQELKV
jgi:hypothetical protein